MADLQSVNFSMTGEQRTATDKAGKNIEGLVQFDPSEKQKKEDPEWVIFKLVDSNRKGGVYIPATDDVYNPETKSTERIRLLAGVNSIWLKDQKNVTEEYAKKNLRNIEFPRGIKIRRVSKIDKTLLEFMRACNSNIGNKLRIGSSRFEFYEYDSAAAEKESLAREAAELDAVLEAKQAKAEDMMKHARFLGLRLNDDLGISKGEDGIRKEYMVYAKRNSAYFMQTKGKPIVEVSYLVSKAIEGGLIDIGREPGRIFWAKDGGMITAMPQGENAQTYLTNLAMTNTQEGIDFKKQLETLVKT